MELKNLIHTNRCLILESKTKTEALLEMIQVVDSEAVVRDIEGLRREIFYREQLMSTGIGQGLGIPHVRFEGVSEPIVVAALCREGISDYESLDGEPVRLVFLILVGADQHKEHLRILSLLVHRLKDEPVRKALVNARDREEFRSILLGESL